MRGSSNQFCPYAQSHQFSPLGTVLVVASPFTPHLVTTLISYVIYQHPFLSHPNAVSLSSEGKCYTNVLTHLMCCPSGASRLLPRAPKALPGLTPFPSSHSPLPIFLLNVTLLLFSRGHTIAQLQTLTNAVSSPTMWFSTWSTQTGANKGQSEAFQA